MKWYLKEFPILHLKPCRIFNLRIKASKHFQREEAEVFSRLIPVIIKHFTFYKYFLASLSLTKEI